MRLVRSKKIVDSNENIKREHAHMSASFLQSLATASMLAMMSMLLAMSAGVSMYYRHVAWYTNIGAILVIRMAASIVLMTIALEQTRKRSIRRTLELAFVNHHIHNALAQIVMASDVTDVAKNERYIKEATTRISEALYRITSQSGSDALSLDVDLGGKELNRGREDRESKWQARGASDRVRWGSST